MARVLVVDDDPLVQQLFVRLLATRGHEVSAASDARTALAMAERHRPEVVFIDQHLPDSRDGTWLVSELRERYPTLAAIIVSGDAAIPSTETLRPGVVAYLLKPIGQDAILVALHAAIDWTTAEARRQSSATEASDERTKSH